MKATQTDNEFIFVDNAQWARVGTFSTRSKAHMAALRKSVGDEAMALLAANVGKTVDLKTLEVTDGSNI